MAEENSTVSPTPDTEPDTLPEAGKTGLTPQRKAAILVLTLCLIGIWLGFRWLIDARTNITTDNAFIESNIHPVSARISGTVTAIHVKDNQQVKKGDLLVELDPGDYRVAAEKAEAAVGVALNETSGDTSQVAAARAAVQSAKARQEQSSIDLKRGEALYGREVIPKEQLDRLHTNQRIANAQLLETQEQLKKAEAVAGITNGPGGKARVRQKQAELLESRLKLAYTRITAPVDGYITRKGIETGATIQPGLALMAVVSLNGSWVTANYKESQLTHIRPGQKVSFKVDAYPGKTFNGEVESIMAGTGAAFSLLPPENASGNYVKVVQRIPVKIMIDQTSDPDHLLRVGMSVIPSVRTGRTTGQVARDLAPFSK
ncbi:MAG: HlyD family secretion protein [Trichlorobacter sp.]|uniref:HlyD family secretion protein n=1 Tax=Trichlorobacter sp. TaxID=2911007 RepID=UPI00256CB825|nr:HlyD family secretion protein [Trichlorobacter sp.]MDK9718808.1 HlyD family secretion protein [Trichlorobacter sp.]